MLSTSYTPTTLIASGHVSTYIIDRRPSDLSDLNIAWSAELVIRPWWIALAGAMTHHFNLPFLPPGNLLSLSIAGGLPYDWRAIH